MSVMSKQRQGPQMILRIYGGPGKPKFKKIMIFFVFVFGHGCITSDQKIASRQLC